MSPLALTPSVFLPQSYWRHGKSAGGVEAAAGKDHLAVKTLARVAHGVHFNHATHFPAVFGGEVRGVDAQRLDVVGLDLRTEAGRAVVRQWDAVNDNLSLILGAAGMQDRVTFVEPTRLRIDEVLQRATRQGTRPGFRCRRCPNG